MKNGIIIWVVILSMCSQKCHAQGFFNQKGAQIKNLIQQMALLQVYIVDLEKGYSIAKNGLKKIVDIKDSDFHLHMDYFDKLKSVNPSIRDYSKGMAVVTMQSDIRSLYNAGTALAEKGLLPGNQTTYIKKVWSQLVEATDLDVNELDFLLSEGDYEMTDDQRLVRIDKLYADVWDKFSFAQHFAAEIRIMMLQSKRELNDVYSGRQLYNLQNP